MFHHKNSSKVLEDHTKVFQDFVVTLIKHTHTYFVEEDNLIQRERDMLAYFKIPYMAACQQFHKQYWLFDRNEELYKYFLKYFTWKLYRSEEGLMEMAADFHIIRSVPGLYQIMAATERSGRKLVSQDSRISHRMRYNPQ